MPMPSASRPPVPLAKRMLAGSMVGVAANGVYLITRLALMPFILAYVPLAHFGLWSICFVILSYAGLSAFGINNSYIKYASEYLISGNHRSMNELMSTGIAAMSLLAAALFAAFWTLTPWLLNLFAVDHEIAHLARFLILATAAAFLLDLVFGAFRALLEAGQHIALVKCFWLGASFLEVVMVFVLLPLGFGIQGVLYAYLFKTVVEIIALAVMARRMTPGLSFSVFHITKRALPSLFVFGGKVQAIGLASIFMDTFDRVVTAALLGLNATGLYEVGRKLPQTAKNVASASFAPFFPAASALGGVWIDSPWPTPRQKMDKYIRIMGAGLGISAMLTLIIGLGRWIGCGLDMTALAGPWPWALPAAAVALVWPGIPCLRWAWTFLQGGEYIQAEELRTLYLRGARHINLLNATLYCMLLAGGHELLLAWVGPGYDDALPVLTLLALSGVVHLATGTGTLVFRGLNRTGRELEYTLFNAAMTASLTPLLTAAMGVLGAALAQALAISTGSALFLLRTNQAFRIDARHYLREAMLPMLAPAAAAIVIYWLFRIWPTHGRWGALLEVFVLGIAYLTLTLTLARLAFLSQQEWTQVTAPVTTRLSRLTSRRRV